MKPWLDDASSLADAIRRGEVKSADAVEASLEAVANSKLNALTMLDAESARKQAAQIDDRIRKGEDPGLLAGVPILVKDVEDAAGWPTTHGSLVFKDNFAEHDSTHVARLRAAGAVLVGKAATSEFGFVAYTSTKLHGVSRNPWDLERTPAGSSGGSAAAVAGGLVPAATAGDGGGSIRIPASYTGLVGMKGSSAAFPAAPVLRMGSSPPSRARSPAACAMPPAGTTSPPATTPATLSACHARTAGRLVSAHGPSGACMSPSP